MDSMNQLTPKEEIQAINSYAERRRLIQQAQRDQAEGRSVDPADKCRCDHCGQIHYRKREAKQ